MDRTTVQRDHIFRHWARHLIYRREVLTEPSKADGLDISRGGHDACPDLIASAWAIPEAQCR